MNEALEAARGAWASPDLGPDDEQAIWARYGGSFTAADHDERVDALLFAKKPDDAARFYSLTSPTRRASFAARIAMQRNAADAERLYQAVIGMVTSDAGLMMDRARYLAREQLRARPRASSLPGPHQFIYTPADPERFYDMLLTLANEAAQDRQWDTAYNIGRHLRDALPPGTDISLQPLCGSRQLHVADLACRNGRARPPGPAVGRNRDVRRLRAGRAARSRSQTKGYYWAGRAALAAGQSQEANAYFQRAAAYPELFYGQLALERLGRSVSPAPASSAPTYAATPGAAQRPSSSSRLVQAVRLIAARQGAPTNAPCSSARSPNCSIMTRTAGLAVELASRSAARTLPSGSRGPRATTARCSTSARAIRPCRHRCQAGCGRWRTASAAGELVRPYAVSHAGARGMMQLMTGTAREQAGKMGVGFDSYAAHHRSQL